MITQSSPPSIGDGSARFVWCWLKGNRQTPCDNERVMDSAVSPDEEERRLVTAYSQASQRYVTAVEALKHHRDMAASLYLTLLKESEAAGRACASARLALEAFRQARRKP